MNTTKSKSTMRTKLKRIAQLSRQDPEAEFRWLMSHFSKENLTSCFHELDGRKAVGIDGRTKDEYGEDLEHNIESLIDRMKSMSYRPSPVREVLIPKDSGGDRPLGISTIEDKIIQLMYAKILESIYDPLFENCSYGFRRDTGAHNAVRDIVGHLRSSRTKIVIDIDLEDYFGTISHKDLLEMLSHKIKDKVF